MAEKHLICEGATVYCSSSLMNSSPATAVPLTVTSQTLVEINGGKLAATDKDCTIMNMNFGICNDPKYTPPSPKPPCMANVKWKKCYKIAEVTGASLKFLTEESEGICQVCSIPGKIRIAYHGQIANVSENMLQNASKEVMASLCFIDYEKDNDKIIIHEK